MSHLPGAVQVDPQEECSIDTLGITPDSKSELFMQIIIDLSLRFCINFIL